MTATLVGPGGEIEIRNDAGDPIDVNIVSGGGGGGTVELGAATLAALETIHAIIDNLPADYPDAAVLAKLEAIRVLVDGVLDITGTVSVSNFPASQPVSGTVAVSNFPATVEVSNDSGSPLPVSGTIALDAPTLAALETITVLISAGQLVGLDSATLAALENIVVSGTVALDAPTLAALESITVAGTVALDAPTLAALESITATISGSVIIGSETFTKKTVTCSGVGNNTVHTPAAGKRVRLYFFGYSAGADTTGNLVGLRFGAAGTVFDQQYLIAPGQPYARNIQAGKRYVDGGVDEALVANLSAAEAVYVNVELEEVS